MIPAKNLFTGSLGKLEDVGGSRFLSTPHTVLVPYEYEIYTPSQDSFVACSLDGRLWLFQDYCVAFKWNESTLRMQTAANIQVSNDRFIARGIDWILTQNYYIQVLDESPYIFRQQVSLDEGFTVSKFYSFLPALSDWQIINGFLIRRYGNEAGNALYSLSVPTGVYLTHKDNNIWGKDSSFIGLASISGDDDLSLEIAQTHSLSGNVSGLAFVGDDLYGFQLKQDSSLCPVSDNCLVYAPASGQWINAFNDEDSSGNIFFDPFNYAAVAVRDNQVNLLQEKKIFQAKGIAQWIAPTRNIAGVTDDFVIARLEHDILATHVNSGLYRESLHEKALALSSASYSGYKLAVGIAGNAVRFNQIQVEYEKKPELEIILLNVFSTNNNVDFHRFWSIYSEEYSTLSYLFKYRVPIFELTSERQYGGFKIIRYDLDMYGDEFWGNVYIETSNTPPDFFDWETDPIEDYYETYYVENFTANMAYLNPDTGEIVSFSVVVNPNNEIHFKTVNGYRRIDYDRTKVLGHPNNFSGSTFDVSDNRIFYDGTFVIYYARDHLHDMNFLVATVPNEIISYIPNTEINSAEQNAVDLDYFYLSGEKIIQHTYSSYTWFYIENVTIQSPTYAYFKNNITGEYFTYDITSILQAILVQGHDYEVKIFSFPDWSSLTGDSNNSFCRITLHAIVFLSITDQYDTSFDRPSKVIVFKTILNS